MGIHDLVKAKKTQRDKDWPMIRRLVESHYKAHGDDATAERIEFWLTESRTPEMLIALAAEHADVARSLVTHRPLLSNAIAADSNAIEAELLAEELAERAADRAYWKPLKAELEQLRHNVRDRSAGGDG
jgi:hypothetical protein